VFLCESAEHARAVAATLGRDQRVVLVAHGPVAGAHVVGRDA
jgi:4-diphosphocytidyl-2-C-methyl-D-erythritol kinase